MRVAIYARFSSDQQNPRSIADQVALARSYAEAKGMTVIEVYEDAGISGRSMFNRPGLLRLIRDAEAGGFDVVLTESLDRLSRSQADTPALYEKLSFHGVRIETLADGGVISEMHVGLKGTMSALFLKDLAQKTRRGQIGRVKAGRIPGGRCYGYDVVKQGDERGLRTLNQEQAAIVRRIFTEYVQGRSPIKIVQALNADGIPGPRGGSLECIDPARIGQASQWHPQQQSVSRPDHLRPATLCQRPHDGQAAVAFQSTGPMAHQRCVRARHREHPAL